MENIKTFKNKSLIISGLVINLIGFIVLIISGMYRSEWNDLFIGNPMFFIYYLVCVIYFFIVLVEIKPFKKSHKRDKKLFTLSASAFFISAFILNHSMQLFATFTEWTKIYICILFFAFIALAFIDKMNRTYRYITLFFTGSGLVMAFYLAIYLIPVYGVGILASIVLGFSVHVFTPLIVVITIIILYIKLEKEFSDKIVFSTGIILPIIIVFIFLFKWDQIQKQIQKSSASIITRLDNDLPSWILLCQDIPDDRFSKMIIEGDLVYDTFDDMWGGWDRGIFDEVERHDPLVNIGLAIMGEINLDRSERIKILKSQHDARHLAQRKLWSGRNLGVIQVLNNIKVYPEYRLAYTEKIVEVKNFNSWNSNQQEAAFTFHLPEGSVATSLSLWINGKEEPSRLTTKSTADSAYVNIVGVQRRDPALLHWQEGNTLTVTVFPCTPEENRRFKIGITRPLNLEDDVLKLKSIYFEGPQLTNALETTVLEFESEYNLNNIVLPHGFKKTLHNKYIYTGKCRSYWEVSCKAIPISSNPFSFNGKTYHLKPQKKKLQKLEVEKVYIDLNKSWTNREFDEVLKLSGGKIKYVYSDKLIEINEENAQNIFNEFGKRNFSLFPIHVINDPDKSLLISKSTELSPNLDDIKKTEFVEKLKSKLSFGNQRINLFQLGNTTSPYLKTLKEFHVFNFDRGNIQDLKNYITKKEFVLENKDKDEVDIDIAEITLVRRNVEGNSIAPNHLLRLFAYNKIMANMGANYFNKNINFSDKLVTMANEAYVVSPVSSLIVLETQKDYERFKIDENKNSLKNASMNSSGAVPEPEEWLLIGLMLFLLTILTLKRYGKLQPVFLRLKK